MTSPASRQLYVRRVLELYRLVPTTTGHLRRSDRHFAGQLHDRGIPLDIVRAALLLVVARRAFRSANSPPLAPIATLHYIRPVVDELIAAPPDPGYLTYVRHKLAAIAPDFAAAAAHQLP